MPCSHWLTTEKKFDKSFANTIEADEKSTYVSIKKYSIHEKSNQSRFRVFRISLNNNFHLLYKAAVKLHTTGPNQHLFLNLQVPATAYENLSVPKHLSIKHLRLQNDLRKKNMSTCHDYLLKNTLQYM